ncbi:integrase [Bradyrhizobium vignae]|uniref:Phage integrase family protein n=1 Tax=Bradyrhizobium vignae TaxID=1549949 RepID=A0A2U3PUI5_9BRAD
MIEAAWLSEMYARYRRELEALSPVDIGLADYDFRVLPGSLSPRWAIYRGMFEDFHREIANGINTLFDYASRLDAWNTVIRGTSEQQLLDLLVEFVEPIAVLALGLPYALRSRFIFATAHLCHQANGSKKPYWKDEFEGDDQLQFLHADRYGSQWKAYPRLKQALEKLGNKDFRTSTRDFRNAYNHRFGPRIGIGITQFVTRRSNPDSSEVAYVFGGAPPLSIEELTPVLKAQARLGLAALSEFQKLVREHEVSIRAYLSSQEESGDHM